MNNRKTDNLWFKIAWAILSVCGVLISYIYITDRVSSKEFRERIINIQSGQSATLNEWINKQVVLENNQKAIIENLTKLAGAVAKNTQHIDSMKESIAGIKNEQIRDCERNKFYNGWTNHDC